MYFLYNVILTIIYLLFISPYFLNFYFLLPGYYRNLNYYPLFQSYFNRKGFKKYKSLRIRDTFRLLRIRKKLIFQLSFTSIFFLFHKSDFWELRRPTSDTRNLDILSKNYSTVISCVLFLSP